MTVVLVVAAVLGGLAVSRSSGNSPAARTESSLVGTTWRLASVTDQGGTWTAPATTSWSLTFAKDATYAALGVPLEEGWVMNCCVTFGYPTGKWDVAARRPVHEVSFYNQWGQPLPFAIPAPVWP